MRKGIVFNIQRFSLNDGSGIRTMIFLKGCPLKCQWCSNPESQQVQPQNLFSRKDCIGCKRCVDCYASFDMEKDDLNTRKADRCPSLALQLSGRLMSVDEIVREVKKDEVFYDISIGGVTLSGGEPFYQWAFVEELVTALKSKYYNVAIETTGYAKWTHIEKSVNKIDTILFDVKHMDSKIHEIYTGVKNELILDNLNKMSKANKNIIIRIPLISGVNDSISNVKVTCELAIKNDIKEIHVLPYHRLGEVKYLKLNREINHFETPQRDKIEEVCNVIQSYGLTYKVNG